MAALTKARRTDAKLKMDKLHMPMSQVKIYRGAIVSIASTGYAINADDASVHKIVGIAEETVDNTGGFDGDEMIHVRRRGLYRFVWSTGNATQIEVGKRAYVIDNQSVNTNIIAANDNYVGRIVKVISVTEVEVFVNALVD
jgi:hypothetical protein